MKILICGAGQVGSSIARQLASEGNSVTLIDQNAELINKISESLDVKAIVGFASYPDVLEAARAQEADMLIAVTYSDEVNMVACQIGHSLFNIPTKIARVRSQNYLLPEWKHLFHNLHLPIDVIISPEVEVARAVIRRLYVPGVLDMIPLANDRMKVVAVDCLPDCPAINLPLQLIRQKTQALNISIIGIIRKGKFSLPTPETILHEGDDVYFIVDDKHLKRALALFGHEEPEAHRVIVLGGGNIGLFIAQNIEANTNTHVKLIEVSRERAELISTALGRTTVINGSALDQEILLEAGVAEADSVLAVTNDDEVNVLGSLLAKRSGCKRAITLINNASYSPLLDTLGIDVTVNPRETTTSTILQHVRRGKVKNVYSISDGMAEIMGVELTAYSPLVGKSLDMIDFPKDALIGAILRGKTTIVPTEETVLEVDDYVVVCCLSSVVKRVEKIFSSHLDGF